MKLSARRSLVLLTALNTLLLAPAHAAPLAGQDETAGQRLSFPDALAMAWAQDPRRSELGTNRYSAESRARAAGSWFAGGPSLSGSYFDDHAIGSNIGYTTYEGGISVPLWLPGQGSATRKVAKAEAEAATERSSEEHMALAVRLLDATAAAMLAHKRMASTQALASAAARLSAHVARAATTGEMTLADQQMAEAAQASAQTDATMAREEAQTAAAGLVALLGSPIVPDILAFTAPQSAEEKLVAHTVEENDPRVRAAQKETAAANADMVLARRSFMPNPQVGVGAIHEAQYGSPWDTRVGVNFTMALPSAVHNAPLLAAARNRVAAAETQETLTRRMVRQEIAQIRARLTSASSTLKSARTAAQQLESRADLMERSWKLQETSLDDALRARQAAYAADLVRDRAEILWHTAIARALIAAGAIPGLEQAPALARRPSARPASSGAEMEIPEDAGTPHTRRPGEPLRIPELVSSPRSSGGPE
ncbi:TolC family protein [Acetobacter farinalis]|uniref:TolC family protein n=1 Tax=Acetobacter farinalis TaxID=1260984 RepID=A0ABT3Q9D9_9PROT|nr:TolC family protein [Acetobacter farinalis]MCX2561906.1 TolC family protein [Acetobacter farinalis]